jgi:hypothetical protein
LGFLGGMSFRIHSGKTCSLVSAFRSPQKTHIRPLPSELMAEKPKSQKPTPKGINPKTGKPYEPVERKAWDGLLKRAAKPGGGSSG